jgi:hypothetical protein
VSNLGARAEGIKDEVHQVTDRAANDFVISIARIGYGVIAIVVLHADLFGLLYKLIEPFLRGAAYFVRRTSRGGRRRSFFVSNSGARAEGIKDGVHHVTDRAANDFVLSIARIGYGVIAIVELHAGLLGLHHKPIERFLPGAADIVYVGPQVSGGRCRRLRCSGSILEISRRLQLRLVVTVALLLILFQVRLRRRRRGNAPVHQWMPSALSCSSEA